MLPIIITRRLTGRNARNWPGLVILGKGIRYPAAVCAQEVYESRWKLNPVNMLRHNFSEAARREMEIMGHEIEVQAAARIYGAAEAAYRAKEAAAMLRGYDGLFQGVHARGLEAAMAAKAGKARRWVSQNIRLIEEYR